MDQILKVAEQKAKTEYGEFFPELNDNEINLQFSKITLGKFFGTTNFKDLKDLLVTLQTTIKNLEDQVRGDCKVITEIISTSDDIRHFEFEKDINFKIKQLEKTKTEIASDKELYYFQASSELKTYSFLNNLSKNTILKLLKEL